MFKEFNNQKGIIEIEGHEFEFRQPPTMRGHIKLIEQLLQNLTSGKPSRFHFYDFNYFDSNTGKWTLGYNLILDEYISIEHCDTGITYQFLKTNIQLAQEILVEMKENIDTFSEFINTQYKRLVLSPEEFTYFYTKNNQPYRESLVTALENLENVLSIMKVI